MAKQITSLTDDQSEALAHLVAAVEAEQSAVALYASNLAAGQERLAAAKLRLEAGLRATGLEALDTDKAPQGSALRAVREEGSGKLLSVHLDDPA